MNKQIILLILTLLFSSCSSDKLTELSVMCLCEATEHYVAGNNELENRTKELTFKNSRLFGLGVSKEDFARSAAILYNLKTELDSSSILKVNIVDQDGSQNRSTIYEFEPDELNAEIPQYLETRELLNSFVKNVYENDIKGCQNQLVQEIEEEKLINVLKNIRNALEEGYVNTKIVSYKKINQQTEVYGGVWTKNETLDLFRITLTATEKGQKILSFEF